MHKFPFISLSWLVIAGVLSNMGAGCTRVDYPGAIFALDGARKIQKHQIGKGAYSITYRLNAKYPAGSELEQLAQRLSNLGYVKLKEDPLNPGVTAGKWGTFVADDKFVFQWIGDWKNSAGDYVRVSLRFYSKLKGRLTSTKQPDENGMDVALVYQTAETLARVLKEMEMLGQYSECRKDTDCFIPTDRCSKECTCGVAINKKFEREWTKFLQQEKCKGDWERFCNVSCPPQTAKCMGKKCVGVEIRAKP